MNCDTVRTRLLSQSNPARVPTALAAHLAGCAGCQTWHQVLVRIEAGIVATAPRVDSTAAKRQLVAKFAEARPPAPVAAPRRRVEVSAPKARPGRPMVAPITPARPAAARQSAGERLARLWPAGLVAAALLVGVLVWSSLRGRPDAPTVAALPPDPLLEKVVAAKVKLDAAAGPVARLAVLDSLERDLHEEATTLSKITPGTEMDSLARMYEKVVGDGIVEQARLMTADERKARLPAYNDRLAKAEQEANRMAAEAPPGSDRPLKDIARAAQKGRIELARMLQG